MGGNVNYVFWKKNIHMEIKNEGVSNFFPHVDMRYIQQIGGW